MLKYKEGVRILISSENIFIFLIKCMHSKIGYSFPLQVTVALTVRSSLCMITALSDSGELYFPVHPFCPANTDCGGRFGKIHFLASQLKKGC